MLSLSGVEKALPYDLFDKKEWEVVGGFVKKLKDEEFVDFIIRSYVSSGDFLSDIESRLEVELVFTLYVGHRNFVVIKIRGLLVVMIQHHSFCQGLFFPNKHAVISLVGSELDIGIVKGFQKEVERLGGFEYILSELCGEEIKERCVFVGYDRPYHYFYDTLPQFLRIVEDFDNEVKIVSINGYDFYDLSVFLPENKHECFGGFRELNDELISRRAVSLVLGHSKRRVLQSVKYDEIILSASKKLMGIDELFSLFKIKQESKFVLWVGVCSEKRSWLNQVEEVRGVFEDLISRNIEFHVFFDGITSSLSIDRYGCGADELVAINGMVQGLLPISKYSILVGEYAHKKICYAESSDFFITSFLTDSMYPARFAGLEGVAHGANVAFSHEHAHARTYFLPKDFVKDQGGSSNWSATSYEIDAGRVKNFFDAFIDDAIRVVRVRKFGFSDLSCSGVEFYDQGESFSLCYSLNRHVYGRCNDDYMSFEKLSASSLKIEGNKEFVLNFSSLATVGKGCELHALVISSGERIDAYKIIPGQSVKLKKYSKDVYVNLYIRLNGEGAVYSGRISFVPMFC